MLAGRSPDLVDYTDFGGAGFESTGWGSLVGNDGQPGDATLGLDHYYARDYDTTTGSWVQPDEWRGLLVRPQSLNRFAYVENSPVAFSDYLGFVAKKAGKKGGIAGGVAAMARIVVSAALGIPAFVNAVKSANTSNKPRPTPSPGPSPKPSVKTPAQESPSYVSESHQRPLKMDCEAETDLLLVFACDPIGGIPLFRAANLIRGAISFSLNQVKGLPGQTTKLQVEETAKNSLLALNETKWGHIMDPKHNWNRLASTKEEIAELMARARANGIRSTSRDHVDYTWNYKGETIVVRTSLEGHLSNGWIIE